MAVQFIPPVVGPQAHNPQTTTIIGTATATTIASSGSPSRQ
jgi:hypothetical protein